MSIIYIRRQHSDGWIKGRSHHHEALLQYQKDETNCTISVRHEKGGLFTATFCKINDDVYQYIDEYGNKVDIAFLEPGKAAFINRVTI